MNALIEAELLREARASIALDRDPYGGTQSLESPNQGTDHTGEETMSEFDYEQTPEEQAAPANENAATAAEARAWLADNAPDLNVGGRGRLSAAARERFESQTGRTIK